MNKLQNKKYSIAGGLKFHREILGFLDNIKDFYGVDEDTIDSVYGSHPGIIWNGGRLVDKFNWNIERTIEIINRYNSRGIGFRFTFTNTLLEEKHLDDKKGNKILRECENKLNSVVVSRDIMRDYIKENYPDYNVILSVCACIKDKNTLKDKITKYDKVSLHPDLNRDYDLIKELGPENLIILVNEECVEKCPYRKNHYDMISSKILYDKEISKEEDYYDKIDKFHKQMSRGDLKLSFKEINKLYNIGVRDYKLQGRERIYREYLQYLTKYIEKEMIQTFIKKNI
jgi:collagenase-like PrtC family protease